MFSSTIIPTVNRSTLSRAVYSVLEQDLAADFEVIVVNDSGEFLPDADWQHSNRVHVINTNRRERSVARNTGAAIAKGKYLHFLDDDDVLLPGALDAFWALDKTQDDNAVWLYGSYQTVDNNGNLIEQIHPGITGNIFSLLVSGEGIAFQASLLMTDRFHAIGGFDTDPKIIGVEDREVGRRMALFGSIAYVPTIVAQIRIGELSSMTNWRIISEGDRIGREKALTMENAFARLRASASSAYLHGRVSRAYFASMVWNLNHKNAFTAASRATAGLAFAGRHILSPDFWRGLKTKIK
jgi:glycosyltransferase involved in cell wall biosynthesis